jgi:hypothetical protein
LDYTMSRSFCTSVRLGFMAGRSAFRNARLGSQHTNSPSLWTNPNGDTGHRFASSICSRFAWGTSRRKPAVSFMTIADLRETSLQQQVGNQSLSLFAWIPPRYSSKFVTEKDCSRALSAIDIIKEKIDMEMTKLIKDQILLQNSAWTVSGLLSLWYIGADLCSSRAHRE